jgi:predicted enzyme related to lactoylglutathione lyase
MPPRLLRVAASVSVLLFAGCATSGPPATEGTRSVSETKAAHTHHAIDYIEISVTDLAAAQRFYAAAFGWRFNDYGPGYAGIQGEGRELGGLRQVSEVRPGGPLVILYSRDLDASVSQVRQAGGRVTKEPFTFPGGRRFHFVDPSGNELAVWSER